MEMASLTSQVFLDIISRKGDEIIENFDILDTLSLRKISERCQELMVKRKKDIIIKFNNALDELIPKWNKISNEHKIIRGEFLDKKGEEYICMYLNVTKHELVCVRFSNDGKFIIRNALSIGRWEWVDLDQYNSLAERYPDLPWIDEFSKFILDAYYEYIQL